MPAFVSQYIEVAVSVRSQKRWALGEEYSVSAMWKWFKNCCSILVAAALALPPHGMCESLRTKALNARPRVQQIRQELGESTALASSPGEAQRARGSQDSAQENAAE